MNTASAAGSSPGLRQRWRVPFCTTVSPGREVDRRAVVELEGHLALKHDLEVDRRGGVHAGSGRAPCGRASPGSVVLELGQRRGDVDVGPARRLTVPAAG